ncbi:MAG: hypothetical protein PHF89_04125 [Eubacteriales bacterium]|nr:hypothetical protein [Eubacteriales bacterium]
MPLYGLFIDGTSSYARFDASAAMQISRRSAHAGAFSPVFAYALDFRKLP